MIINIEVPVYERTITGYINQILSYDTETCQYTVRYTDKNVIKTISAPIDARCLSFSINGPWRFNSQIIQYLFSIGVDRISSIPDVYHELLFNLGKPLIIEKTFPGFSDLVSILIEIQNDLCEVETTTVTHPVTKEELTAISSINGSTDFMNICGKVLLTGKKPNYIAIKELKKLGFTVSPIEQDSNRWIFGCIYTDKGLIIFE